MIMVMKTMVRRIKGMMLLMQLEESSMRHRMRSLVIRIDHQQWTRIQVMPLIRSEVSLVRQHVKAMRSFSHKIKIWQLVKNRRKLIKMPVMH